MALFWFLIVFAITYNQGAARPADGEFGFRTKNGLDDSNDLGSGENMKFKVPTVIQQGLVITIKGRLNTTDKTFTMQLLSSMDAKQECQMKFNFKTQALDITPIIDNDYGPAIYNWDQTSQEDPPFSLRLIARENGHGDAFGMYFNGNEGGESQPLMCKINKFEDINYIVMKEGVAQVDSLLFEFEEHH